MRCLAAIAALTLSVLLSGCATTTSVVVLDPTRKFPPSEQVEILLKPPQRPYIELAKLESQGMVGEPEPALLESARQAARALGADAVLVIETTSQYHPPTVIEDPWPAYSPWLYRDPWGRYPYWLAPAPFGYFPPRTFPGGYAYTVRALAIKYQP